MATTWDDTGGRAVMTGKGVTYSTPEGPVYAEILGHLGKGRIILLIGMSEPQPRKPDEPPPPRPETKRVVDVPYDESGAPGTWRWPE